MALQKINLGTTVGDKTGDGARIAGAKINANFDYLLVPHPFNAFKLIQKGFGNVLPTPEPGDIYCGWTNDGLIRYTEAIYISGSLSDSNNFTPLVQTEI